MNIQWKTLELTNKIKMFIVSLICIAVSIISIYLHLLVVDNVFPHFYYPPIILLTVWWGYSGWHMSIPFAMTLPVIHLASGIHVPVMDDIIRAVVMCAVSGVIALGVERYKKSEWIYREFFNTSKDCVFITSTNGNWIDMNDRAPELFGYGNKDELSKINVKELYENPKERDRLIQKIEHSGCTEDFNINLRKKDSDIINTLITAVAKRDRKGNTMGFQGTIKDITERKRAEEELKRYRDHLEELVKERTERIHILENQRREIERYAYAGQVAARVAHEINNPLAGIKNSFLLIKDAVSPNHPYHHYMDLIENEINRLACIVKQMFGLYRPELNIKKVFVLDELINDILELIESTRRKQDVNIITSANSLHVDHLPQSLLRQVLYNILINALEASDPGGEIIINAKIEDKNLIISVSDKGHGIPDEIKPYIFDPIYSTKKADQKGLGLGLSITKKIIDELFGTISFESEPGKGTIFTVTLPINNNQGLE